MSDEIMNSLEGLIASSGELSGSLKKTSSKTVENDELFRVRLMANILLSRLEKQLEKGEDADAECFARWWGERENALSILTKITQILTKTIPLEKLAEDDSIKEQPITDEEIAIFERYMKRCIEEGTVI